MVCLSRCLDRAWLAGLGLLAACAPLPHNESDTAGEATQDGTTAPETTLPTTTISTDPPGCEPGSSCGFCSYCSDDGDCLPEVSCCASHGLDVFRCQPPPECYGDDDCPSAHVCDNERCVPSPRLPACGPEASAVQWDMSRSPDSFDLADLDGDGSLDLFAPIPTLAAIEIAYNDGAGHFATGTMVELGEPQTDLDAAAGDFDGDGDLDLAVARPDVGDLVLVFGEHGKFLTGPSLPASAPPRSVTAVDVDLDGALDLVAIGGDLGSVSVWLGDGLGGFSAEMFAPDLVEAADATVVDVDLDGAPELLTLRDSAMTLHRRDPPGMWALSGAFSLGDSGWSQALMTDLGGEPAPEAVALRADFDGGLARVMKGDGPGTWVYQPAIYRTVSPLLGGRVADVTHDGLADLVSATDFERLVVLLGDGAGGFVCEQAHPLTAATSPDLLALGDLDGDGRTDIVVGALDSPTITVLTVP